VVSVLDSGAVGPGFKSQPQSLANCSHPLCLCSPSSDIGSSPLKGCEGNCRPGGSNGSLPPVLWLSSSAGWLPRTGISSGTPRSVIEYGLPFFRYYVAASLCVACQSGWETRTERLTRSWSRTCPGVSAASQSAGRPAGDFPTDSDWGCWRYPQSISAAAAAAYSSPPCCCPAVHATVSHCSRHVRLQNPIQSKYGHSVGQPSNWGRLKNRTKEPNPTHHHTHTRARV